MTQSSGFGIGLLLLALGRSEPANADGTLLTWSSRSIPGMTEARWEEAKKRDVAAILDLNRRASSWADCYEVALGAVQHRGDPALLQGLVEQLGDPTMRTLEGASQLVIWERISTGDLLFEGKGAQIDDDLFQVAGRPLSSGGALGRWRQHAEGEMGTPAQDVGHKGG